MTSAEKLLTQLRRLAGDSSMTELAVADSEALAMDVPGLFDRLPRTFPRAVVMGIRLLDAVFEGIDDRPTPLYFHMYRQANYALDRAALAAANLLQAHGCDAIAVPASQIVIRDPMQGHISHKMLGWAAGMGWIGRQSLLVHPLYGARMRYVSILTDAPLPPGAPLERNCGDCRRCIDVCPAGAIGETAGDFDLDACYNKLTEFSKIPRVGQHVCGVCLKACKGQDRPEEELR